MGNDKPTGQTILITGATGMMGSALAVALAADNTVYGAARFRDLAMRDRLEQAGVQCVQHDLHDADLSAWPSNVDTLMHFAVEWGSDAEKSFDFNGFLVGRMLEHFSQLDQFVIGSTVAVYVAGGKIDLTEHSPTIPAGVYGSSKLVGDAIATHISRQRELRGAVLRYWFPYSDDLAATSDYYQGLLKRLERSDTFILPDDDSGCQQPLFIDDLVRITIDSLQHASTDPFVLNVAGHERLTPRQVVLTMAEVFEVEPKIEYGPADQCNVLSGSYDLAKLKQAPGLGQVTFREGMQRLRARHH